MSKPDLQDVIDEVTKIKNDATSMFRRSEALLLLLENHIGNHEWRKLMEQKGEVVETSQLSPPQIPIPLAERTDLKYARIAERRCSCGRRLINRTVEKKAVLYCMTCHKEVL